MKLRALSIIPMILTLNVPHGHAGNPFLRFCTSNGGTPEVLQLESDQVMLCDFGSAGISAPDLWKFKTSNENSTAITAYLNANDSSSEAEACANAGGQIASSTRLNTDIVHSICQFSDQSFIDATTLALGKNASQNASLTQVLE